MLAIDHIVIAAKDPAQAAIDFGKKHGVTTLEGGRHTNWGTYNHLAYFRNDCYIEWIGIFDESLAVRSNNPLVQQLFQALEADIERPIQFALRTDNMDAYLNHFYTLDIAHTGPISGSRQKPNGTTLAWRMLFPDFGAVAAPFLIEWSEAKNSPQDERYLNKQQMKFVTCGLGLDVMEQVYRLDIADKSIALENGMLVLQIDEDIRFHLE